MRWPWSRLAEKIGQLQKDLDDVRKLANSAKDRADRLPTHIKFDGGSITPECLERNITDRLSSGLPDLIRVALREIDTTRILQDVLREGAVKDTVVAALVERFSGIEFAEINKQVAAELAEYSPEIDMDTLCAELAPLIAEKVVKEIPLETLIEALVDYIFDNDLFDLDDLATELVDKLAERLQVSTIPVEK